MKAKASPMLQSTPMDAAPSIFLLINYLGWGSLLYSSKFSSPLTGLNLKKNQWIKNCALKSRGEGGWYDGLIFLSIPSKRRPFYLSSHYQNHGPSGAHRSGLQGETFSWIKYIGIHAGISYIKELQRSEMGRIRKWTLIFKGYEKGDGSCSLTVLSWFIYHKDAFLCFYFLMFTFNSFFTIFFIWLNIFYHLCHKFNFMYSNTINQDKCTFNYVFGKKSIQQALLMPN